MSFKLTVLGSSSATPTKLRNPSAHLLNVNEHLYLIDCGEGTQMQIKKYGFSLKKINKIFISHLHGDHYLGLPGLLFTMHLFGRTNTLHLYGPPKLKDILDVIFAASDSVLSYPLEFHPLKKMKAYTLFEDEKMSIGCFPLKHRVPTWGFVFREADKERNINKDFLIKYDVSIDEIKQIKKGADFVSPGGQIILNKNITKGPVKGRSYAYCSDTAYYEKILPHIMNVDLLYHEATFLSLLSKDASDKQHSTAEEAARIAKLADAAHLLIGHFSARYKNTEPLADEARIVFANTLTVEDGYTYSVEKNHSLKIIPHTLHL